MQEYIEMIDPFWVEVIAIGVSAALVVAAAYVSLWPTPEPDKTVTISGPPSTTTTLETPEWAESIEFTKEDVEECSSGKILEVAKGIGEKQADELIHKVYQYIITGAPKVEHARGWESAPVMLEPGAFVEPFQGSFKLPPTWPGMRVPAGTEVVPHTARQALISFANKNPDPKSFPGGEHSFDQAARRLTNDHMAEVAETEGRAQLKLISARNRLASIKDTRDELKELVRELGAK